MAKTVRDYTVESPSGEVRVKKLNEEDAKRLEDLGYEVRRGRHDSASKGKKRQEPEGDK